MFERNNTEIFVAKELETCIDIKVWNVLALMLQHSGCLVSQASDLLNEFSQINRTYKIMKTCGQFLPF